MCILGGTQPSRSWQEYSEMIPKYCWHREAIHGATFSVWMDGFPDGNNIFYLLICFDAGRLITILEMNTSARKMNRQTKCYYRV